MKLKIWFKSPKAYVLLTLIAYLLMTSLGEWTTKGLYNAGIAVATVVAVDMIAGLIIRRKRNIPDGAVITGLIISLILSITTSWKIVALTAAIAIVSKYVLVYRKKTVFNPAAVGLLLSVPLFHTEQSWWGAFGDLPGWAALLLLPGGYLIVNKVKKYPQALAFLGTTFILLFLMGHYHSGDAYDAYRAPFINATLFFGLFMLTDPPTSPGKVGRQIVFGIVTAVVGTAIYDAFGGLIYLYVGVMIANLYARLISEATSSAGKQQVRNRQIRAETYR